MKKTLSLTFLLFAVSFLFAQRIQIKGKVLNPAKLPAENATIYLLKAKDSTIINYTNSGKAGNFQLSIFQTDEPGILKIDDGKSMVYEKKLPNFKKDLDLGDIELQKELVSTIEGIVVHASPVKIKKDTIEFNASAIKVRPDSKIEELLKQIPGVEISNDGKITINGKDVDQVMINGKPFFDKDGKIALKNIPADIIKNIQFTTTKTAEEEQSGKLAKSNNATINFNIDEKKNKGFISRLTVGYGSDKRYESNLLTSYFKKDTKISLLGASNNINSTGFSSDEVFDSMGYGRNAWLMQGGSVTYEGGSTYYTMNSANRKGIMTSSLLGINYSDKWAKEVDLKTLGIMYSKNNLNTHSKVQRTTLLPDYTLDTKSENDGKNDTEQFSFDNALNIKPDSLTSIYFSPGLTINRSKNISNSVSSTTKDGVLLNDNSSFNNQETLQQSFSPNIYFTRKFKSNKKRQWNVNINNDFSQTKTDNLGISDTHFYEGAGSNIERNQLSKRKINSNKSQFSLSYQEPILDSTNVSIGIKYKYNKNKNLLDVNDFDVITGKYTSYNDQLSNLMQQETNTLAPTLDFELEKSKLNIWSSFNFNFTNTKTESAFQNQNFELRKNDFLPEYNLGMQYTIKENLRLNIYNSGSFTIPSANQLSTFVDQSNPLISITGNPNLKNTWRNGMNFYLNNSVVQKNINYYINMNLNYYDNAVTQVSYYDNSGKQFISYANVSGNKSVYAGGGFTKSWKWNENTNKFSINPSLGISHDYSKGFINGIEFQSKINSLRPRINFSYEIKDKLTIKPSYSLSYSNSKYQNYIIDEANFTTNQLKLELTNYFFKSNLVFGNDFEYNTNSFTTPGFQKNFYFWNTSFGYSFFNKQLTAKVKVYDVLNQNQSISRNINSAFIEDREDLILKRYVMFSLSMKLNKFAGKKQQ